MRRCTRGGALLAVGMLAAGCSSAPSSVSGTVTLDGKSLTNGMVTFFPVGGGPAAYGRIEAGGKYTLQTGAKKGLQPGEYVVTVVATEAVADSPHAAPIPKPITPEHYGDQEKTDLRANVTRGSNTVDLKLTSRR